MSMCLCTHVFLVLSVCVYVCVFVCVCVYVCVCVKIATAGPDFRKEHGNSFHGDRTVIYGQEGRFSEYIEVN